MMTWYSFSCCSTDCSSTSGSAVVRIADNISACVCCQPESRISTMYKPLSLLILGVFLQQQLPAPFQTPWFRKITRSVPMPDGHHLTLPAGFSISPFAEKLDH